MLDDDIRCRSVDLFIDKAELGRYLLANQSVKGQTRR